jgi:putative flippase GtrA
MVKHTSFQLFKFLTVGGFGTLTNLSIFFIFVDLLDFHHIPIAIVAFAASVIQNYALNHIWTFSDTMFGKNMTLPVFIRFVFISLIGLLVNLVVLVIIVNVFQPQWKVLAQGFGIACGTAVNYLGAKYWVFTQ